MFKAFVTVFSAFSAISGEMSPFDISDACEANDESPTSARYLTLLGSSSIRTLYY